MNNTFRYIIVDTFNGQGYSDSGIVKDITFNNVTEQQAKYLALEVAREEFGERYLPVSDDQEIKVTYQDDALCMDDSEDQGAVHFIKVPDDTYGILIEPSVNGVTVLDKSLFTEAYEGIIAGLEGDRDELEQFIEDIIEFGEGAAHTDLGYEILIKLNK